MATATATAVREKPATQVITGVVRLSFANIWEPKSINGSEPKYSVCLLVDKTDTATVNKIKAAMGAATAEGVTKFGAKFKGKLKLPLRDGDEERADDENYAGHYFINANSKQAPDIVDAAREPIEDEDKVYSGCYARASINFFPFDTNGNKGVAVGLNGLQKVKDGSRLSGRRANAAEDFDDGFEPEYADDDFMG